MGQSAAYENKNADSKTRSPLLLDAQSQISTP